MEAGSRPSTLLDSYPDKQYSYWDAPFYEGSGYIYGTYVPHDAQGLINKLGGDEPFVAWLDALFANPPTRERGFNKGLYNHNNEPGFLAAFLYSHAGRPDLTQERVRHILATEYKTGRGGLPGNDDSGAMSSWYVWSAMVFIQMPANLTTISAVLSFRVRRSTWVMDERLRSSQLKLRQPICTCNQQL